MQVHFVPEAKALMCMSIVATFIIFYYKFYFPNPCDRPAGFSLYQEEIATQLIKKGSHYTQIKSVLGNGCEMKSSNGKVVLWHSKDGQTKIRLFLKGDKIQKYNLK